MIVFIDGANGTGKDYCIRMITREATRLQVPWSLTSIKDVIHNEEHKAELIKRNELGFTYDQIKQLYKDHLALVDRAIKLQAIDPKRIVIVNRFLPSFYVYQHKLMGGSKEAVSLTRVHSLLRAYQKKLKNVSYKIIHLNSDLETIIQRLKLRDGADNVDIDKITKLHQYYVEYANSLGLLFNNTLVTSSDNFDPRLFFDYSKFNKSEIKDHAIS